MPKRKKKDKERVLEADRKFVEENPCIYRKGVKTLRGCSTCRSNKKKNVVIHECEKYGECTILARRAKDDEGKYVKVCIACDDRTGPDGISKRNKEGAVLVDDSKVVDCKHFGKKVGRRFAPDGKLRGDRYACDHDRLPKTTSLDECAFCTFRESHNAPASKLKKKISKEPQLVQLEVPKEYKDHEEVVRAPRFKKTNKPSRKEVEDPEVFSGKAFATPRQARRSRHQLAYQRHPSDKSSVSGVMFNRMRKPMDMGNLLHDSNIFVVCSGPSLNQLDLSKVNMRGVVSMGINNAPAHVKTNMMIHGDPSKKFHDAVWRDPSIMKFTPKTMLKRDVRTRTSSGKIEVYSKVMYMPNVVGYTRNSHFDPDNFLTEDTISFGNGKNGQEKNGYPRVLSTLFSALKMSWHLGAKRIFLLGCDMNMSFDQAYAFDEDKSKGACRSNNSSYRKIQQLLGMATGHFRDVGLQVYNCNPKSALELYPFMSFDNAIKLATEGIEQVPDTRGWYAKK